MLGPELQVKVAAFAGEWIWALCTAHPGHFGNVACLGANAMKHLPTSSAKLRETQITTMCWGLAHAYRALFNTIQYPQGEEKISGSDDKATGTVATPTPATGTAVAPAPVTGTASEPGNQPVPASVTPIHKKNSWKRKSACLERNDEKAGPSRGEEEVEELINKMETTRSLSLSELQDM
ncbi:hypothetical protein QYF61_010698 [Mycteria americana]|uniref:Uncharacterized protein n=1 Tax=Mycteria americana TaxID=33587 RepID=A0AAN7NLM2_MYCAM|nr:hypothetical protein QYF61_010698 [Mycteria americana]